MSDSEGNGWSEYQKLVLSKLESLELGQADLRQQVVDLRVDMGGLKVKSGAWGLMGGAVTAAIMLAMRYLTGRKD